MKAFFTGAKAEAENMCEEDYDKEDSIIVVMDKVIRQKNEKFLSVLQKMRPPGAIDEDEVEFLESRISNLS